MKKITSFSESFTTKIIRRRVTAVTMATLWSIIFIGVYFVPWMACHSLGDDPAEQFKKFMAEFKKSYDSEAEQEKRFDIFKSNLEIAKKLNRKPNNHAQYGVTMFSDLTPDEFKTKYLLPYNGFTLPAIKESIPDTPTPSSPSRFQSHTTPSSPRRSASKSYPKMGNNYLSWLERNPYYPPVEDQGLTNYSPLFAVVGALSILYSIHQKQAINLSKQQFIDCGESLRKRGRDENDRAILDYLKENYLAVEADYPFRANGAKGKCDEAAAAEGVASVAKIWTPKSRFQVEDALRNTPLISTVVGVNLQHYKSGFIMDCPYVNDANLPVVIVSNSIATTGGGLDIPYYLLRTSWGPKYGMLKGHVKVKRDACGMESIIYGLKLKTKGGCLFGICNSFRKKN